MKKEIMRRANALIELLDACSDSDFVDEVCAEVSCNEPFEIDGEEE